MFLLSLILASISASSAVSPETALRWLVNGNVRFNKSHVRTDGQSSADVQRLSGAQAPHTVVLSCSDARVPPELVFDQKLGEIFAVRSAGEVVDAVGIGSIEYAVENLGARLIVVMGHTSCDAVKTAMSTMDGASAGSVAAETVVKLIQPHLIPFKGKTPSANYERESWANAVGIARDLIRRSPALGGKWSKGELWIVPALYDLKNGRVSFLENLKVEAMIRAPASAG